jgi:hypothetical protein
MYFVLHLDFVRFVLLRETRCIDCGVTYKSIIRKYLVISEHLIQTALVLISLLVIQNTNDNTIIVI